MAVLTRLALINEGKYRAGVDSTAVDLTTEINQVLRDITGRYDLLRGNYATGNLTADAANNYLSEQNTIDASTPTVPTNVKDIEHIKAGSSRTEVVKKDFPEFWSYGTVTFGAATVPDKFVRDPALQRTMLRSYPSSGTVAYYVWYTKYSETLSADTSSHWLGEEFDETIILGLAAYACEITKDFEKANYFRLLYEEDLRMKSEVMRKRMVRYEFPER